MLKLKLPKPSADGEQSSPAQPTPTSASTGVGIKLKLSAPPTPVNEKPGSTNFASATAASTAKSKKQSTQPKPTGSATKKTTAKKRAANDDTISPAAKRVASAPSRKLSLKPPVAQSGAESSKVRIPLTKRTASLPKIVDLRARQRAPPRPKGVGYDSEDSDAETDPAIQQAFVLRMEPGEDADYLREAIATGQIGPHPSSGDAEVSLKFVEKNYRRAIIKIRGRNYAAALVDLPCIVETMKSFDKKGWWKVSDISQMLLVLGRCANEEEAKTCPLPREVNKNNLHYAHGLTPPLHWVRKRRFRKRVNHTDIRNVEEEVERLLAEDRQYEESGGMVRTDFQDRMDLERSQEPQYDDQDEDMDGEAIETVETDGPQYDEEYDEEDEEDGDAAMEAELQAAFAADDMPISQLVSDSPAPIADQAASMAAVEAMQEDSEETPMDTPAGPGAETPAQVEQSSDEDESDEDEDEDSPDVVDEDAAAKAAERAQQLEEVADLEREVERARQKAQAMTNQLLRQREMQKLAALEEDLRVKKGVFGLDAED